MISKISNLLVVAGLTCLILAGTFLVIGHDPNNYVTNQQAESLGNFAYTLLALGLLTRLVGDR